MSLQWHHWESPYKYQSPLLGLRIINPHFRPFITLNWASWLQIPWLTLIGTVRCIILQVALDLLTVIDNILDASNADSIDCNVSARWEWIYWEFSVSTMINEIKIHLMFSKKFCIKYNFLVGTTTHTKTVAFIVFNSEFTSLRIINVR